MIDQTEIAAMVERLRDGKLTWGDRWGSADMLEALSAELHLMKTAGVIEVAVRNPSVMEYVKHWEDRATKAEAQLAVSEAARVEAEARGLSRSTGLIGSGDQWILMTTGITPPSVSIMLTLVISPYARLHPAIGGQRDLDSTRPCLTLKAMMKSSCTSQRRMKQSPPHMNVEPPSKDPSYDPTRAHCRLDQRRGFEPCARPP